VVGGWRKLHNEELHKLDVSPNIIRVTKSRSMRRRNAARMEEMRSAYKILVGKPEGKRPRGIPRYRWDDNTRMGLRETG
jgi:hypothetical protein